MTVTTSRGEDRKLLGQLGRAAMRADRAFPIAGTNEDFAVVLAFLAMKFVNRHAQKVTFCCKNTSRLRFNRREQRYEGSLFSPLPSVHYHGDNFSRWG